MTTKEVKELRNHANNIRRMVPNIREGQALMNGLFAWHAETYQAITNTDVDPFYDDSRIPAFLAKIQSN